MDAQLAQFMSVFKKNYLVSALPDSAINEIADLARYKVAVAGETLIEKGDKGNDLYVLLEGSVNLYGPEGDKIIELGPPNILGEVALVDDLERTANVVCVGLVKCAVIPGKDLRKYMGRNKEVGFHMLSNLSRVLSMRLRRTNEQLLNLMDKSRDPWKNVT